MRKGRFNTTRYDSVGKKPTIALPSDADTMPMDDFHRKTTVRWAMA